MDYQTPIKAVEAINLEIMDEIPNDDTYINRLICKHSVKNVIAILKNDGYTKCASNMLNQFILMNQVPEGTFISDIKLIKIFKDWMYNKQIFSIDEDFYDVLLSTDTVTLTKDIFDYLPYKTFYIDLSDSKKAQEELVCNGIFYNVHSEKLENLEPNSRLYNSYMDYKNNFIVEDESQIKDVWVIHSIRIKGEMNYHDIAVIPNYNISIPAFNYSEYDEITEFDYGKNKLIPIGKHTVKVSERKYMMFIFSILLYLASYNPDVVENEDTKRTYKKPNPNFPPKNKFSEIQAHNVGYKIGTAYRSWKKAKRESDSSSIPTGRKNRPHPVRAHWRKQWYGPRDNQEQRLIWINEFYTGLKNAEDLKDSPAIIHKVKNE